MKLDFSKVVSRESKKLKSNGSKAHPVSCQNVRIGHRVIPERGMVEFEGMVGRTRVGFTEFEYEGIDDD
jgi:hypothetical protein